MFVRRNFLDPSRGRGKMAAKVDSEMAGPGGLKLGGLVEGMCPNVLMKNFFRSVNGRGKMAAKVGSIGG